MEVIFEDLKDNEQTRILLSKLLKSPHKFDMSIRDLNTSELNRDVWNVLDPHSYTPVRGNMLKDYIINLPHEQREVADRVVELMDNI